MDKVVVPERRKNADKKKTAALRTGTAILKKLFVDIKCSIIRAK